MSLTLAPRPDVDRLAAQFAAAGAVSVPGFLSADSAAGLAAELQANDSWVEIFRAGEKVYEMAHRDYQAMPEPQKGELRRMVEDAAKTGLQYRYRAIRVSEDPVERASRALLLDAFADLLNTPHAQALMRAITASRKIAFADAQATDYRAGDFLTDHDDGVEGKGRVAAYVFGLTTGWQADWGGLLLFDNDQEVSGFIPDFNVLRVFAVPRSHHVSYVAPWVTARRLSVTGWLRSGSPEAAAQSGS